MAEIKWEGEFICLTARHDGRYNGALQRVEEYLNEAHLHNYELFETFHNSKPDAKYDLMGLVFRKIQIQIVDDTKRKIDMIFDSYKIRKVDSQVVNGESIETKIYRFCEIHESVKFGKDAIVGSHTFIGKDVCIGENVRIQGHCYIPTGVTICKDAFIAPGVIFLNDKYPPSKGKYWGKIIIEQGASIGGGVTILPNVIIGKSAVIGAGAVVTKNVPDGETWVGNPAKKMKVKTNNEPSL